MTRKKKSPASVQVVAVEWSDAFFVVRGILDTGPALQHTVGFVVHEDEAQLILAHEIRSNEDWMEEEMDYTKVPKLMIVKRVELGPVTIVSEEPNETTRP